MNQRTEPLGQPAQARSFSSLPFVFHASWANYRVMIYGLPDITVERISTSYNFKNSIPGLRIEYLPTSTDVLAAPADWRIECVVGSPCVFYEKGKRKIIYRYQDENSVEPDLLNLTLQILELAVDEMPHCLMIHGSYVMDKTKGALLFGPPLSGKTTVAVQAILSGWSCRSGERLVLDTGTLTVLAGTPLHNLNENLARRFFPSLRFGYLSTEEVAGGLASGASFDSSLAIMVIPKVTDEVAYKRVRVLRLSKNMAFRFLTLDIGTYAQGSFFLHYSHHSRVPAHSLDSIRRRTERARRVVRLCEQIPTFFVEGHPHDIVEWLARSEEHK